MSHSVHVAPPSIAPTRRPIFIQAMWRTGSTYIWKKFRDQPQYRTYYEPLYEVLARPIQQVRSLESAVTTEYLRHPPLDRPYFDEYPFTDCGVNFFEKPLSYERYCLAEYDPDDALYIYIRNLMEHAVLQGQFAVLQFNRGLLRAGWLTQHFEPINILILRRPLNIWKSFLSIPDPYFMRSLCTILGQNAAKPPLCWLPRWLDIPCRIHKTIDEDFEFYGPLAVLNAPVFYPAFFDFNLVSTLHCAQYTHCVLDLDEISANPSVRVAAENRLRELGIALSLEDCRLPACNSAPEDGEWLAYESFSRRILRRIFLEHGLLLSREKFAEIRPFIGPYFRELFAEFIISAAESTARVTFEAKLRHDRGIRLFHARSYDACVSEISEALALESTAERWNGWASAQAACSHRVLAELGFRQALRVEPGNTEACANLGAFLSSLGRHSDALPLLERALPAADAGSRLTLQRLIAAARNAATAAPIAFDDAQTHTANPTYALPCSGFTIFLTGLSGAGKTTIARALFDKLTAVRGQAVTLLDGDAIRTNLSPELGFSREHRDLNIRRIGFAASEVTKCGGVAICAVIAPFDRARKQARAMVEACGPFFLVHVSTPLAICELRDPRGLYAKARAGVISQFTGISDPYEEPSDADLHVDTNECSPGDAVHQILSFISHKSAPASHRALTRSSLLPETEPQPLG